MILRSLQISGVGPIGLSQQFETQHDIPSKVLYVQGDWLSSFVFKVKVVGLAGSSSRTISPVSMFAFFPRLWWSTSAPPCFQSLSSHSTEEVTKVKTTTFLMRSASLPRIHVSALSGG